MVTWDVTVDGWITLLLGFNKMEFLLKMPILMLEEIKLASISHLYSLILDF